MKITKTKTFTLTPELREPVKIQYLNRKGVVESVQFTKFQDEELKTKTNLYNAAGLEYAYTIDSNTTNTYYSPYLTKEGFDWLKDLLLSPFVLVNSKYVKVLDKTYKLDALQQLYTIELDCAPLYEENKISL